SCVHPLSDFRLLSSSYENFPWENPPSSVNATLCHQEVSNILFYKLNLNPNKADICRGLG
ncbi:hypothetical protein ACQP3F_26620, partial [Escherichia coli]